METKELTDWIISFFLTSTGTKWNPSNELKTQLLDYLSLFKKEDHKTENDLKLCLITLINEKIGLNKKWFRFFIDQCAKNKLIFNYHQKLDIENSINIPNINFTEWILRNISKDENLLFFANKVEEERNKALKNVDEILIDDKKAHIVIESIFCSFIYYCIPEILVHKKLNQQCHDGYESDYWKHLVKYHSSQTNRDCGLYIIDFDTICSKTDTYAKRINILFSLVKKGYNELSNHCYLAVIIGDKFQDKWNVISDLTIFAEKFLEREINHSYFRWKDIEQKTSHYIKGLGLENSKFQFANEGFVYRDCYISYNNGNENCVLLFEKNKRDERPIPCPKCRTYNIQSNSYPTIGVRSWECKNIFCGDKSKYNRGKRYSLSSIIRQQAILDDQNLISKSILKKWRRDIVESATKDELIEMLFRFYSLVGDNIFYFGDGSFLSSELFGRKVTIKKNMDMANQEAFSNYKNLYFFKRFLIDNDKNLQNDREIKTYKKNGLELINGDALHILSKIPENSIDGSITSPPYYNAREYSSWENIYCYLYDMYNIAKKTYRCLKEGSPYLFNIFDYFDNENIIVFSDMGKKRMILSSYISYIFRYIGYTLIRNIPWDKGEIEGSRNFNQGNLSPYYQSPHNCWEHILVYSKGEPKFNINKLPLSLKAKPVFKIKNGQNVYGHSAPFPKELPELLLNLLKKGDTVLDPFSGSMTTGRTAYLRGFKSINIEINEDYFNLSIKLFENDIKNYSQLSLF